MEVAHGLGKHAPKWAAWSKTTWPSGVTVWTVTPHFQPILVVERRGGRLTAVAIAFSRKPGSPKEFPLGFQDRLPKAEVPLEVVQDRPSPVEARAVQVYHVPTGRFAGRQSSSISRFLTTQRLRWLF